MFVLVLFGALASLLYQPFRPVQSEGLPIVFELELPDFGQPPSSQPELTIPSADVNLVLVHILKPVADNIDYGAIRTSLNGQATATISTVVAGSRGKLVKIDLKRLPGYQFVTGRNTVEVWAQNRRGRSYYASFVIKTRNQNWNEDFAYNVQLAPGAADKNPPQLILFEPERPLEIGSAQTSLTVKVSGMATSNNSIKRVTVDGKSVQLKVGPSTTTRQLTRLNNVERSVNFTTTARLSTESRQVVVEAEDGAGSRTQVVVPVVERRPGVNVSGRKYALLIGISKYQNNLKGIPNLEYAESDARALYQFLQRPEGGRFSPENMLLLANEQATLGRIREALSSFVTKASADDLLVIFFAGHGSPDPRAPQNLYIIAHDTIVSDMANTALAMPDLRRYIEQNARSKRLVLLLDACHSAGFATEGTREVSNNLANLYLETLLYREEGRAIITSSDVNEPSRESIKWGNGHGIFTYSVLEGLKGLADSNGDRLVSVGELFHYVRQRVRLETEFQQNPRMLVGDNENLALSIAAMH
jgi:hypothetical protein